MTKNTIYIILLLIALTNSHCQHTTNQQPDTEKVHNREPAEPHPTHHNLEDGINLSQKHSPNLISCDLDGDSLPDTVTIVQNVQNKKYGLKIVFGNKRIAYLGMGKEIAGQGFDDIDWVGIFEVAPKNEVYYNNVDEDGTILTEDQVKESDKIRLQNDGIFIHQAESCGGGVIYLKNGNFEWIQQE